VGLVSWHWTGTAPTLAMALATAPVEHRSMSLSIRNQRDRFDKTSRLDPARMILATPRHSECIVAAIYLVPISKHSQRPPIQIELGLVLRLPVIFARVCSSFIQVGKHNLFDIFNIGHTCAGNRSQPSILNQKIPGSEWTQTFDTLLWLKTVISSYLRTHQHN
jgi:hypothetical protein